MRSNNSNLLSKRIWRGLTSKGSLHEENQLLVLLELLKYKIPAGCCDSGLRYFGLDLCFIRNGPVTILGEDPHVLCFCVALGNSGCYSGVQASTMWNYTKPTSRPSSQLMRTPLVIV